MIEADASEDSAAEHDASGTPPVFLVSPRYREALRAAIEVTGRGVAAVRRVEDAPRRFQASATLIAIVDARGNLATGLETMRVLAPLIERRGAALIAMVSRADAVALADVHAAGATHFVVGGRGSGELAHTLRFAERYVRRLRARGDMGAVASAQAARGGGARWEWRRGSANVELSPALAVLLGEPEGVLRLRLPEAFAHLEPSDRDDVARALGRLARGGLSGELSHRMIVDGRVRVIAHHVRAHREADGRLARLTATVEDLDAVLIERRLAVHFDILTGLANADFARDWTEQLLSSASAYDPACILMLLSLTRFDGINAAYGRKVADGLLQAVARRLRRVVGADKPEARLLARMGGAEFALAMAGPVRLAEATVLARRLGTAFDQPFMVDGKVIHLACRVGIAVGDADTRSADMLLLNASAALSRAKEGEPNSFEVFADTSTGDLFARTASLGDDLRAAIDRDGFDLLYQPQVDIATNRICGVEALIRWRHPDLGLLPTETLMAIAERAEVGPRLGRYIIAKALGEAARWPDTLSSLRMAVNVTADDMAANDFADRVLGAVEASGFAADRLTIEVTESGLVRDAAHAARALDALRARGIRIAIDDFGTGYSSLAYLSALPVDYLKVDKSLVTDLFGSARDRVVVRGVVDIARSLDLTVIAEGVETEAQRDAAGRAGCQLYQGYLCARPVNAVALVGLVQEWNYA